MDVYSLKSDHPLFTTETDHAWNFMHMYNIEYLYGFRPIYTHKKILD